MEEKRNWLGPYAPEGSAFKEFVQQMKLVYNLMLDRRVHPMTKLIPLVSLAYVVLPPDLIPDLIPGLGQMDDLAIVLLGVRFFLELSPEDVVQSHLKQLVQKARGTWNVQDTPPPTEPQKPEADDEVVDGQFRKMDE